VKGITGESFIHESLILPQGIPALCDDSGLRTPILATLQPSTREAWWFAIPAVGTPTAGSRSLVRRLEAPSMSAWLPAPPPWLPACPTWPPPLGQGQRAASSSSAPGGTGGQRKRGNVSCATAMGHLFRTPQKRQRTAGGAEEAGPQAQGTQRRVSPPPPPPSGPPPPQPPPPSVPPPPPPPEGDLPQGHHQQQQQQQQQQQWSPRFQGHWKV
jgi:hypothetical protein